MYEFFEQTEIFMRFGFSTIVFHRLCKTAPNGDKKTAFSTKRWRGRLILPCFLWISLWSLLKTDRTDRVWKTLRGVLTLPK
jgi:hypothetical protein